MIESLDRWQTLVGAVVGGLVALLAALVVAYRAERRSDLAAAMHLVGTLVQVRVASTQLEALAKERGIADENDRAAWQAEKLVWLRPKLSPMFEASVARVMPIDVAAAAHLQLFLSQYLDLEDKLTRLQPDIEAYQRGVEPQRGKDYVIADARAAKRLFDAVATHAACAEHLISKFVLSSGAFWLSLWCKLFPDKKTRHCRECLKGS